MPKQNQTRGIMTTNVERSPVVTLKTIRTTDERPFPMPWLNRRAIRKDLEATQFLETKVGGCFVFNGGLLLWVATNGDWYRVAEIDPRKHEVSVYLGAMWARAIDKATNVICTPSEKFEIRDWTLDLNNRTYI